MVELVLEKEQKHRQPGLLKTVVNWGKSDLVGKLLQDKSLIEQRSPQLVQQAFQLALKLAGVTKQFEVQLIDHLLTHGANPANVYISDLFKLGPEGVKEDVFGYLGTLNPRGNRRSARRRSAQKTLVRTFSKKMLARRTTRALLSPRDEEPPLSRQSSDVGKSLSQKSVTKELEKQRREDEAKEEAKARYAEAAKDVAKNTTPWQDGHVKLMQRLIPGYNDYAKAHTHATAFDLVLWAIMVGAFDLAEVLWKHKSCESPLRAALIGQHMCGHIIKHKKIRVKDLEALSKKLSDHSLGMLDFLRDAEEARKLLLSQDGQLVTVGMAGKRTGSLLDLAIDFENISFVAHHHSQNILEEQWMGRSPLCGRVRLKKKEDIGWLVLQLLLMPFGLKFVQPRFLVF